MGLKFQKTKPKAGRGAEHQTGRRNLRNKEIKERETLQTGAQSHPTCLADYRIAQVQRRAAGDQAAKATAGSHESKAEILAPADHN